MIWIFLKPLVSPRTTDYNSVMITTKILPLKLLIASMLLATQGLIHAGAPSAEPFKAANPLRADPSKTQVFAPSNPFGVQGPTFGVHSSPRANPEFNARKIIEHRLSMAKPTTFFGEWEADKWTFAANHCGTIAKLGKELDAVKKIPIYFSENNKAPENDALYCSALATAGPAVECFDLYARKPPFTLPTGGFSLNYLFLKNARDAENGMVHSVSGYCNLVRNAPHTQQLFVGIGTLKWLAEPMSQTFYTNNGTRQLNVGTVSFKVAGMPGNPMPQMVIIASQ